MRRLIVEFSKEEIKIPDPAYNLLFQNVKTAEILQLLKQDREEVAAIVKVELEKEIPNIEESFKLFSGKTIVKIIEQQENGVYLFFIKYKLRSNSSTLDLFGRNIAYLVSREVKEGKLKLTFLGSDTQIKRVLGKLERFGVHFRIVSLTEAKLSSDSPLNALTEKQRKVITMHTTCGTTIYLEKSTLEN